MIPNEGPPYVIAGSGNRWRLHRRYVLVDPDGLVSEVYTPMAGEGYSDLGHAAQALLELNQAAGWQR